MIVDMGEVSASLETDQLHVKDDGPIGLRPNSEPSSSPINAYLERFTSASATALEKKDASGTTDASRRDLLRGRTR